jgi:hypothetical protein
MAIPASYTEAELKTFMLAAVAELGAVLGLTTSSFAEAVNETLLAYGVDDIADATDIPKLRALARVEAWKVAVVAAGSRIDWSEAGASFKQSQYRAAANNGLSLAQSEAVPYGGGLAGNVVTVGTMTMNDPYAVVSDEELDD